MENNRPRGREKNITGGKGSVQRRGQGTGSGPVGGGTRGNGSSGNSSGGRRRQNNNSSGGARSGGSRSPIGIIILIAAVLLGGGGGLASFLGGSGSESTSSYTASDLISMFGSGSGTSQSGSSTGTWTYGNNTGVLNTDVDDQAAEKRTVIYGDGSDQNTVMVYMCGADLESRSGMATKDLIEMTNATIGSNVNVIVYTGGAKTWNNNTVSSSVNQIYKISDGKMTCLNKNAGNNVMTDPATLTSFVQYCSENYPANRMDLIFWDHGGGSVSGYGYDEKNPSSGSMSLAGINQALKDAGVTFDFIGFDACLMATVENALMLDDYADYLIASEETEPGIGWYYTNWLTKLSEDPGMSTIELGKIIADDFVSECASSCKGQKTTLSVIDLAETAAVVPDALSAFSKDTTEMISEEYQTVSNARYQAREFAQSSNINQVDMVHLAKNLGTKEGDALAEALLSAVKYNKTSSNMTNAYGISVYFPAGKTSKVDSAASTFEEIGIEDYSDCIKAAAAMNVSGQAAAGGTTDSLSSLMTALGGSSSASSSSSSYGSEEALASLVTQLLAGSLGNVSIDGLTSQNTGFLSQSAKSLDADSIAAYISENHIDPDALYWTDDETPVLAMEDEQWALVQELELSVYYDDGEGYIDLGLDNVFEFTDEGSLIGEYDGTWLAIDGQPVAYYHETTVDDGDEYTITGYVPALVNGDRMNLILVFDSENPYGYIAGASAVYSVEETETEAKNLEALKDGDTIDFLCDYYTYDGEYNDSYMLGEQITYSSDLSISNIEIGDNVSAMYKLTDIYGQSYWTEAIE